MLDQVPKIAKAQSMKMIHLDESLNVDEILRNASKIKRWRPIEFGNYEGFTIPGLILKDPSYFYWAISLQLFKDWVGLQATSVESRLRHIKLPQNVSRPSVFVLNLKDGMFQDFCIREKAHLDKRKRDGVFIASHLDFSLVSRPNRNTDRARAKMLERIKHYYFEKEADRLRPKDFEDFLGNPDNFASGSPKRYLPEVLRWDDPSILIETKREKPGRRELSPQAIKRIEEARYQKMLRELNKYDD